ncbi:MAG TPA: hypothetical protein VEX64_03630, partial [Pyrinomonadaceae bacterium]|nr:hypothetical protein [Pyrinomonadaceae bacterium]
MISSLASFGYAKIKVGKRPQAAILATGNELVSVEQTPAEDEIRNSNSIALKIYAEASGAQVSIPALVGDNIEDLKSVIFSAT